MTFKGLFQLKLFSDSIIFLDADQGYVPTLQSVVWKGVEQWWPRVRGGLKVWRWEGCQNRGTDPFLLQLLRQASEGLFLPSVLACSGSFSTECFEVALFWCFNNCCSFAAKTFCTGNPHCSVTDQRSRRANVLLWVSSVMNCHNITVSTPDFWV